MQYVDYIINNLFRIKSLAEFNSDYKQIWIQLITLYNSYVWNKILNYKIEFNYNFWNTIGIELNWINNFNSLAFNLEIIFVIKIISFCYKNSYIYLKWHKM
jgi:hypothetical protein